MRTAARRFGGFHEGSGRDKQESGCGFCRESDEISDKGTYTRDATCAQHFEIILLLRDKRLQSR